jgi:uncharacterized protein (DUF3084 family)
MGQLATFEKDGEEVRKRFDELNAENVRKQQQAKQQAFAKAKDRARQLANDVKDGQKRITMVTTAIAKATGEAKTKLENELKQLKEGVEKGEGERDAASEQYARMNQDDARQQVEHRKTQMDDIDKRIADAKAKAEW